MTHAIKTWRNVSQAKFMPQGDLTLSRSNLLFEDLSLELSRKHYICPLLLFVRIFSVVWNTERLQPAPFDRHLGQADAKTYQVLTAAQSGPEEDGKRHHRRHTQSNGKWIDIKVIPLVSSWEGLPRLRRRLGPINALGIHIFALKDQSENLENSQQLLYIFHAFYLKVISAVPLLHGNSNDDNVFPPRIPKSRPSCLLWILSFANARSMRDSRESSLESKPTNRW